MRTLYLVLLVLSFLVLSCESDHLTKVCPASDLCAVVEGQVITTDLPNALGACSLGRTSYDDFCIVSCVGYAGPQEEVCDMVDNDCDGYTDEDFDKDGDGFSPCHGDCDDTDFDVAPHRQEVCNNKDDNCDGSIDEDLSVSCWTGPPGTNFGDLSLCATGTKTCSLGVWSACTGQVWPKLHEICDGLDNDCDGQTDEDEPFHCGPASTLGVCSLGTQICGSEQETYCVGAYFPGEELCDGADNDCDGAIDEDLEKTCQTECGVGVETCEAGGWSACSARRPSLEVCDGVDNDCDGIVDNDCPCEVGRVVACRKDLVHPVTGLPMHCGIGTKVCGPDGEYGPCVYYGIQPEACNDWDDDCDGITDDFVVSCGDPALDGIGICLSGTSSCSAGSRSPCIGEVLPQTEVCNNLDDNCDGRVDNDLNPHDKVDVFFLLDGSGSMCNQVSSLISGISSWLPDFIRTEHRFGVGVYPGSSTLVEMISPLTDISSFLRAMQTYSCNYSGVEPGWNAVFEATDPNDRLNIGWRSRTGTITGAYPYVIVVTDESGNQGTMTKSMLTSRTTNCSVGSCVPGDKWEFFVITTSMFFSEWDTPTFNEPNRIIDMNPVSPSRYTDILRGILSNVCR